LILIAKTLKRIKNTWVQMCSHYEKMGWFVIGLATRFLNYNDHLKLIATQCISIGISAITQVAWILTNATHHMWNYIHI
jgi:hypothetical protein